MIYNAKDKYNGERDLAAEILKIIPLIEKHFKPFNGERALIQSGRSAKFEKVCKDFRDECEKISDARIYVDGSMYSMHVNIDIHRPDTGKQSCSYYKDYLHIARLDHDNPQAFRYTFKPEESIKVREAILSTDFSTLERINSEIKQKRDDISTLKSSIPYTFKSLVTE